MSNTDARYNYIRRLCHYDDDKTPEEEPRRREEEPENNESKLEKPKTYYGNTRLPYGLCKEAGIDTTGMEPHEAWEALKNGTGVTHGEVIKQVQENGTVEGVAKKIEDEHPKTSETPEKPTDKETIYEAKQRALEEKYWNIPEMAEAKATYTKLKDGFQKAAAEVMNGNKPFYKIDFSWMKKEKFSTLTNLEDKIGELVNSGDNEGASFYYDKLNQLDTLSTAINTISDLSEYASPLCEMAAKSGTDYEKGKSVNVQSLCDLYGQIENELTGHTDYAMSALNTFCPGLKEKITSDIESSMIAKDAVKFSCKLNELYNKVVDFNTLEEANVSDFYAELKDTDFGKKNPDKVMGYYTGLVKYQKEIHDCLKDIKGTYNADYWTEEQKKVRLAALKSTYWGNFKSLLFKETNNDAEEAYNSALAEGLSKCVQLCDYDKLKETLAPTATNKQMSEGEFDKITANEENSIKGGYVKFDDSAFTDERKANAIWCRSIDESVNTFGSWTSRAFTRATPQQRMSVYNYTLGSGHCNRPLSGYFFDGPKTAGTSKKWETKWYKGMGGGDLNIEGGLEDINNVTEFLNNVTLPKDTWIQRGVDSGGAKALFGFDVLTKENLEAAMNSGKTFQQKGFMSCGAAKGTGFDCCSVVMNIFCPQGTHAGYIAPISFFGGDPNYKGGAFQYNHRENEMLVQRNTFLRIRKVTEGTDGRYYVDVDVVGQAPVDYNKIPKQSEE